MMRIPNFLAAGSRATLPLVLSLVAAMPATVNAEKPDVDSEEDEVSRSIDNLRPMVLQDAQRLRTASTMSKLAAGRVGTRRNVDFIRVSPDVGGESGLGFKIHDFDDTEVQQAVLKLFPPVGGVWLDYRTVLPHAELLARSLYKQGLDPLPYVDHTRGKYGRDKLLCLCKLFYIEQLYEHEDQNRAISLLAEELTEFSEAVIPASYLADSLVRPAVEMAIRDVKRSSDRRALLPLAAVVGNAHSLKVVKDTFQDLNYHPKGYDTALKTLEYRIGLTDTEKQRVWTEEERSFFQIEIPVDNSIIGNASGALLAGSLRARYHGAEFSQDFLYRKLPSPIAIVFLGIQGDKAELITLERLLREEGAFRDLMDWSIKTIKDGGIPVGYDSRYGARKSK